MDKTFNFFKTKPKGTADRPRNPSKSNSSKHSYSKHSDKGKGSVIKPATLTKKEREIREAIEYRYQRSKMRSYALVTGREQGRGRSSSHSSDMEEYKMLKKMNVVDLKDYHRKLENNKSNTSSQQKKKFNLRFKFRDVASSSAIRTQGNESSQKNASLTKNAYLGKSHKDATPTKTKKTEQWKFISIQLKQDLSKPKNRKTEVKINSHRSYNVQENGKPKNKPNGSSSMNKYFDKVPKLGLSKLGRHY